MCLAPTVVSFEVLPFSPVVSIVVSIVSFRRLPEVVCGRSSVSRTTQR